MFTLLKKKKTEQEIVAEIHNEFDTAEDRLLDEADKLLLELNIPTETNIETKANKLERLGFVNSEVVKRANELKTHRNEQEQKLVKTKEQAELIRYYKQTYPFQKFLTEKELERICEKYNLVFAPVSNYVKDVPEKNIKEIENAMPLKSLDAIKNRQLLKITKFWSGISDSIKDKLKGTLDLSNISLNEYRAVLGGGSDAVLKKVFNLNFDGYLFTEAKMVEEHREGLFIAAPPSHFNLQGLSKQGKYSFLKMTETEVKDPIVFRYCKGGIQVLSKWGLEANDELLVNEKLN